MFFLGIDVGKYTHVASLMNEKSKIIFKAFSFSNSSDGAESILQKIQPYISNLEVDMEATGHYWLSIYSFLSKNNLTIHVINPIQTDGWRKGMEIRKRKTDIIDSVLITDFIRYGNFVETYFADENTMSLRNLSRFLNYLKSSISDLKRKSICILDQIFPEYSSIFSDIFGKTSKELLVQLNSPSDFEDITSKQLESILSQITLKNFAAKKINHISKIAKNSFGIRFCIESFSFQMKLLIEQISFIEKQVIDVENEISKLLDKINSPITTIPGIGNIIGAIILGEIGDINRFSNASKLVAYAGLDVSISQPGEYESTRNHMSKRGSPYLRRAIFQAAFVASNNDPVFSAYYQKKRLEWKHLNVAIGAVSQKLCHTIYAILKNNLSYEVHQ